MLGAIGLGLVRGFTRNIKEEKLRRIADKERVDAYQDMMVKATTENPNMTPAAIAYMGSAIQNARGKLDEREAIDMFGTQSDSLDIDFTKDLPMIRALMKQPEEEEKEFQVPFANFIQGTERDENGDLIKEAYLGIPLAVDDINPSNAAGVLNWTQTGYLQSEAVQERMRKFPSLAQQAKEMVAVAAGIFSADITKIGIKEGRTEETNAGSIVDDALKTVNDFVMPFTGQGTVGVSEAGANITASQNRGEKVHTGIKLSNGSIQQFALTEEAESTMQAAASAFGVPLNEFGSFVQETLYNNPMNVFAGNGDVHAQLYGGTMAFVADVATNAGVNPTAILDPTSGQVLRDDSVLLNVYDSLEKQAKNVGKPGQLTFAKMVNIAAPLMQVQSEDKKFAGKFAVVTQRDTRTNKTYIMGLMSLKDKQVTELIDQEAAVGATLGQLNQAIAARQEFDSEFVRKIAKIYGWAVEAVMDGTGAFFGDTAEQRNWYGGNVDPNRTLEDGDVYVTADYAAKKMAAAKKEGQAFAEFEALKISLAFQLARAADPSGRLSNQDIEQQMTQLGSLTDTKATALTKLNLIKERLEAQHPKLQAVSRLLQSNDRVTLASMAGAEATLGVINMEAKVNRIRKESRGGNVEADYRLVPHTSFDAFVKEDKDNIIYSENSQTIYYDVNGDRLTQRPSVRPKGSPAPAPAGQAQQPQAGASPSPQPAPSSSGVGYDDSEVNVTQGKGNTVTGFELTLKGQNQPLQGSFLWNGSQWVAK